MADEAFALSPISARAALPGEEDYAAISEAFMETSRGRWFLTEYAKRNRNADTRMVLDAVARIEQSLAAQKEETLSAQREGLAARSRPQMPPPLKRPQSRDRRGRSRRQPPESRTGRHPHRGRDGGGFRDRGAGWPRAGAAPGRRPQGFAGAAGDRLAVAGDRQ